MFGTRLKRPRTTKDKGKGKQTSGTLPFPEANPLTVPQEIRRKALETHRVLEPSRWICQYTIQTLGILDTVKTLTGRLGLWDFLCDEVETYRGITIEFLSSYEFNRGTRTMTFNLGGYFISIHTTDLLRLFGLSQENVDHMRMTLGFYHDMKEHHFRALVMHDVLTEQRVKNISHPAIRYIQRVLAHTLFARGETASVFHEGDMSYICSMLRRNNGEMDYMPHITYHLAKHINNVANNTQPRGIVRIGGIVTKIARALNIPTGDDVVAGHTKVDLDGLIRARLIKWDTIQEAYVNLGVAGLIHRLPLPTQLDPLDHSTWKIVDPPLEGQLPPPPPPPVAPAEQQAGHAQGDPSMQQMLALMQAMQTSINTLNLNMTTRMDAFDQRLDDIETHAAASHYYSHRGYTRANPEYEDDPPTPPYQRRAAERREREMAREREAAAQAAQQAEEAANDEEEDVDDEEEDPANDMDEED